MHPLLKVPPSDDVVTMEYKNGRLYFGSYSFAASWQDIGPTVIDVALDASDDQLLMLRFRYNDTELEGSGLLKRVKHTEMWADQKLQAAAKILAPLPISIEDLWGIIEDRAKTELKY